MREEDESCAGPLFGGGGDFLPLDLPFVEVGNLVHYHPRKTSTKVYDFMHDEAHDSGCEDVVLHVLVPALDTNISKGTSEKPGDINIRPRDAQRC